MALSIDFKVDDTLRAAFKKLKDDTSVRAVVADIEGEIIKLRGDPISATDDLSADLTTVQRVITENKLEACFVLIREKEKKFVQVMMVPETIKPKARMLYASSASHLRSESRLPSAPEVHITSTNDINSSTLFSRDVKGDRKQLMTQHEKIEADIQAMPVVPNSTHMPGVSCPLTPKAETAIADYGSDKVGCVVCIVDHGKLDVEKTLPPRYTMPDVVAAVPEGQPRFVLLHWANNVKILAYVVPPGAKPKDRMPYASSKASFITQLESKGMKIDKRVETDNAEQIESSVKEALDGADFEKDVEQIAPKTLMPKGPKMLI